MQNCQRNNKNQEQKHPSFLLQLFYGYAIIKIYKLICVEIKNIRQSIIYYKPPPGGMMLKSVRLHIVRS